MLPSQFFPRVFHVCTTIQVRAAKIMFSKKSVAFAYDCFFSSDKFHLIQCKIKQESCKMFEQFNKKFIKKHSCNS